MGVYWVVNGPCSVHHVFTGLSLSRNRINKRANHRLEGAGLEHDDRVLPNEVYVGSPFQVHSNDFNLSKSFVISIWLRHPPQRVVCVSEELDEQG